MLLKKQAISDDMLLTTGDRPHRWRVRHMALRDLLNYRPIGAVRLALSLQMGHKEDGGVGLTVVDNVTLPTCTLCTESGTDYL